MSNRDRSIVLRLGKCYTLDLKTFYEYYSGLTLRRSLALLDSRTIIVDDGLLYFIILSQFKPDVLVRLVHECII